MARLCGSRKAKAPSSSPPTLPLLDSVRPDRHRPLVQTDVNSLFARAEQAFLAQRFDAARRDLGEVQRLAGDHPAVLHLLALVEKRLGNAEAARRAFGRALALAPGDAQLLGNFANLLNELGEHEEALALYGRALTANAGFRDARLNRALLLQKLGRLEEALADLDAICVSGHADARVHSARGSVLKEIGRIDEAAAAYEAALAAEPARLVALHGRARVAMERGEEGASSFYVRALQQKPGDLELVLGLAEALEAEGDANGLRLLSEVVSSHPGWVAGHEVLARMRSEAGHGEAFADHYPRSLARRPNDRPLHYSYWQTLARAERHRDALAALRGARAQLADERHMRLMEAIFASESGDPHAALAVLDGLGETGTFDVAFARGRILLRAGDAAGAAQLFEQVTRIDPASVNGWAHLDLAWRLIGDERHQWLAGQPGLFGAREIGLCPDELADTAELLRKLHITRAHPIGQSLRGGTQTRGRLFSRREPEIARLQDAITAAVREHMAALPPADPAHPLLRHRDAAMAIQGSWSVRLTNQGFHVNHVHPEGTLSSACYISLPSTIGKEATRDGWLELGRPPVELGLPLEPLATIEPKPGRLALFPSYLFHGTRPFPEGERLTVAFDVVAR